MDKTKEKIIEEFGNKLFHTILTFQPRTILQEAQLTKDIPEVCNGVLDGDGYRKVLSLVKQLLSHQKQEIVEEIEEDYICWVLRSIKKYNGKTKWWELKDKAEARSLEDYD